MLPLTSQLVARLVSAEFVAALMVCPALLLIPAPDGRYRWLGLGPMLPTRLAWVLMELPAVVVPVWPFAAFTAANLVPRALSHHKWYRATFPDYPAERRALVPYLR